MGAKSSKKAEDPNATTTTTDPNATKGGADPILHKNRSTDELDQLWRDTRLPFKYRQTLEDWELNAMADEAESTGTPLRYIIQSKARQQKEEQEHKEFEEMPVHEHSFETATHRTGFRFNPWKYLAGIFTMCVVPSAIFCGICVMFILMYYMMPWITLFICLGIFAASFFLLFMGSMNGNLPTALSGTLYSIATVGGVLAGMVIYYEHTFHYWAASEGRQYTNVRADALAAAHADAGVIVFTDSAQVDTTKTIGYKSGSTYCVAPISMTDSIERQVQYWAAGIDCCNGRGFFDCDDSTNKEARAALIIRDNPSSMLFKSELEYYKHAVEMSKEIYGLSAAKEPFFVRWTVDVAAKAWGYFVESWIWFVYYTIAHALVNLILAILFQGVIMTNMNTSESSFDTMMLKAPGADEETPLLHKDATITKGPGYYSQGAGRWKGLDAPQQEPTPTFSTGLQNVQQGTIAGQNSYDQTVVTGVPVAGPTQTQYGELDQTTIVTNPQY